MKNKIIAILFILFAVTDLVSAQGCPELLTDVRIFNPTVTNVTNCISSNNGSIEFTYTATHNPANLSYQISSRNRNTGVKTPFAPTNVGLKTITLTGLQSGVYDSFYIQGPLGCTDTIVFPVTVSNPTNLFYTPIPYNVTGCKGSANGRIEFLFTAIASNFNYSVTAFDTNSVAYGPHSPVGNKITIPNLAANRFVSFRIDGPGGCVDFVSQTVDIFEPANPLEIDTIIVFNATCGGNGSLAIQVKGGNSPYLYNTVGGNPPQNYAGPSPDNLTGGLYDITVTDAIGCVVSRNNIQILQGDTFEVEIVLNGSNIINLGESVDGTVQLASGSSGFNSANFRYEWQNDYRITCLDCQTPTFFPCKDTTYRVIVRDDSAGCVASATQKIIVSGQFDPFVPNAFTPNGSGPAQNEYIKVFGNGVSNVELVVFDSKGAMVYKGSGEQDDALWDGTMGGTLLNSGVYLYDARVTSICSEEVVKRGQILLIR